MDVVDVTVLAGAIDDVDQLTQKITGVLVGSVMSFMVVASVAVTWAKTKSVLSAGVALVGAAALWFAVMNAAVFRDSVGEDIAPSSSTKSAGAGHAVVRVIEPVPGDRR
ncbi:hypothetical protein OG842_44965 (plasmid) [Streptomyces sp. NBC_00376]|uniref:hypothetical protein n=1 Tax=Streptomyces sp. NBC_00376 TaxID=2975730 RepID=UPI002E24FA23